MLSFQPAIGSVPYLNALPLIQGLPYPVRTETPRRLLQLILQGELSLAMLSTVCLFQHPGLYLVPGMGIGSHGCVESVRFFFNRPHLTPPELGTAALSPESNTANVLLRLYLKRTGYRATHTLTDRGETVPDAELVIGDKALTRADPFGSVDLGQWWREWTGLPFVFAAWISRRPKLAAPLYQHLLACKTKNVADIGRCLDSCTATWNIPRAMQEDYLRYSIRYDLGETELQGLYRFREECIRAEILSNAHPVQMVTIE